MFKALTAGRKVKRSDSINSYKMTITKSGDHSGAGSKQPESTAGSSRKLIRNDGDDIESDLSSSMVRVDIEDLSGSSSVNMTTHSLRKCKTHILIPYFWLLKLVGWKPFGQDSFSEGRRCCWKFLNTLYIIFMFLILFYTYVYDIMACQWKLNMKEDILPDLSSTTTTSSPTTSLHNASRHNASRIGGGAVLDMVLINQTANKIPFVPPAPASTLGDNSTGACEHIVTTYIIPDILHLAAFIIGLCYFRVKENEHLYALMEKVFLQTANLQSRTISQQHLISKLRLFFIFGALWVFLTMCLQGLFVYTFGVERQNFLSHYSPPKESVAFLVWLWGLFTVDLIGVAIANCVNLAVVLNYAIQCELLRFYVHTLRTRLRERSTSLKAAMKDVLSIRESITLLNSAIARMTSLSIIRSAEMFIIGLRILLLNEDDHWKIWLYRSVFLLVWGISFVFPLIQAASMNAACAKFKTVSLGIRVFGYQNHSEQELDSFLSFIANTTLRAKLVHIPVKPSYLLGTLIVTCMVLLLLFQTSVMGPAGRMF